MTKHRVGIIGLGGMGERFAEVFENHPEWNLVAVCETDSRKVERFQLEFPDKAVYADYHALLADPDIDLVYIAVPPKFHYPIVMEAIRQQKHILCEKPLANSLSEAMEMASAAEKAKIIHAINFPTVYRNVFKELQSRLEARAIGHVRRIEVQVHFHTWPRPWQQNSWIATREQGGFVREVFPHFIQMIQQCFGNVSSVDSYLEYPHDGVSSESDFVGVMKLEQGQTVLLNGVSNVAQKEQVEMTIYGEKGTLQLQNWRSLRVGGDGEAPQTIQIEENAHLHDLASELAKAINGEQGKLIDFQQGYAVQEVLEKLLKRS